MSITTGPVHIAALVDELLVDLGATIHDPGPGLSRTFTAPNGRTYPLPPRCECWSCGPHPGRTQPPSPPATSPTSTPDRRTP